MLKREIYLEKIRPYYDSELIKVITGLRRCGKICAFGANQAGTFGKGNC